MAAVPKTLRPLCALSNPTRACRASAARSVAAARRLPGGSFLGGAAGLSPLRTPTPGTLQQQQQARSSGNMRGSSLVMASFLGVGAPEAVMVGVVALVVFGPKGLAQAAKSLGAAAKSVAPTVRELASVSQDLRNSIEDEIGLDEIKRDFQSATDFNPRPKTTTRPGTEAEGMSAVTPDMAKAMDPEIDAKRQEAAAAAWGGQVPQTLEPDEPQTKDLASMSVDELQAEIARRKAADSGNK